MGMIPVPPPISLEEFMQRRQAEQVATMLNSKLLSTGELREMFMGTDNSFRVPILSEGINLTTYENFCAYCGRGFTDISKSCSGCGAPFEARKNTKVVLPKPNESVIGGCLCSEEKPCVNCRILNMFVTGAIFIGTSVLVLMCFF